jgi:replication factor C subunit 3/5
VVVPTRGGICVVAWGTAAPQPAAPLLLAAHPAHHARARCHCAAVIEKYTRNTRFCLICNYVSKIIPALQSRCTRFRFPPLDEAHVRQRLQHVVQAEQ